MSYQGLDMTPDDKPYRMSLVSNSGQIFTFDNTATRANIFNKKSLKDEMGSTRNTQESRASQMQMMMMRESDAMMTY